MRPLFEGIGRRVSMGEANKRNPSLEQLTAQERECLRLVAQSLSSKEIARELGISKASVDTYCNRARAKLRVGDRRTAARLVAAADGGLITIAAAPQSATPDHLGSTAPDRFAFAGAGMMAGGFLPPMSALGFRMRMVASFIVAALLALSFGMLLAGMEALNLVASQAANSAHHAAK